MVISNYPTLCARKSYFTLDIRVRKTYDVDSMKNAFHGMPKVISIQLGVEQHLRDLVRRIR